MKEFDFDELDRAVNSLMAKRDDDGDASQASAPVAPDTPADTPAPVSDSSTTAPIQPREEAPSVTPESRENTTTVPVANNRPDSGIAPRRGTVIDGIHSSTTRPSENLRPSRQGKTIQPDNAPSPNGPLIDGFVRPATSTDMATPAEEGDPTTEIDEVTSPMVESPLKQLTEQPVDDTDKTVVTPSDNTAFDPIEQPAEPPVQESEPASSDIEQTNETPADSESVSSGNATDDADNNSAIDNMITPTTTEASPQPAFDTTGANSPFLPNTKVEKRPLGKGADSSEAKDQPSETTEEGDTGTPAVATVLPAELHDDLVDIESRIAEAPEKTTPTTDFTKRYTPPAESAVSPSATSPTSAPSATPPPSEAQGAIYAADAHQQPLQHPAKKKSGGMLVVWIVVLLLIGAGGGAALYFSGIL